MENKIKERIEQLLKEELELEFEKQKKEMIEKLDRRKDKIIAEVAVELFTMVKMESYGNELTIRVITDKLKQNT